MTKAPPAMIDAAAAAIANARGARRGAPAIANILQVLPDKLRTEFREDAEAALEAVGAVDVLAQLRGLRTALQLLVDELDIDPATTNIQFRAQGQPLAQVPLATLLKHSDAALRKAAAFEPIATAPGGR